jgi:ribosomal protein S18 acetylase RimI-like enzyme
MEHVEIRRVTVDEIDRLRRIGIQTFTETFSPDNTPENLSRYVEAGFSPEKLGRELNDKGSEFYFALLDKTVIGYLKVNFGHSQTELKAEHGLEIERIYVLKEFHGKDVGQRLYEKALEISGRIRADYIWLGVWEKNPRAIRFYEKNGFVAFDKHMFRVGDDDQTDIMMKLRLKRQAK